MDAFSAALNDLLVNTFHSILQLEEEALLRLSAGQLSINEMHLLEAIAQGGDEGRSITDIAQALGITLPSVTAAVNKLAYKGFASKHKGQEDRRQVMVHLSRQGQRAAVAHRFFHRQMVNSVTQGLDENEKATLLTGLKRLNAYFRQQEKTLDQLLPRVSKALGAGNEPETVDDTQKLATKPHRGEALIKAVKKKVRSKRPLTENT